MKEKRNFFIVICLLACILVSGCGSRKAKDQRQDGYYTAMMEEYSFGWREYVTICVMDGKIVSVEYNAKNASGFVKSWDNVYMGNMNSVKGTYPNRYTRYYAAQLLEEQGADNIDMLGIPDGIYLEIELEDRNIKIKESHIKVENN